MGRPWRPAALTRTLWTPCCLQCGGSQAAVDAARPLLEPMGKRVIYCAGRRLAAAAAALCHSTTPPLLLLLPARECPQPHLALPRAGAGGGNGAGETAKLCNNLVLGVSMAAVSEGLALGKRLGLVSAGWRRGGAGLRGRGLGLGFRCPGTPTPLPPALLPRLSPQDPGLLSEIFNTSSARCWSSGGCCPLLRLLRCCRVEHAVGARACGRRPPRAALVSTSMPTPALRARLQTRTTRCRAPWRACRRRAATKAASPRASWSRTWAWCSRRRGTATRPRRWQSRRKSARRAAGGGMGDGMCGGRGGEGAATPVPPSPPCRLYEQVDPALDFSAVYKHFYNKS